MGLALADMKTGDTVGSQPGAGAVDRPAAGLYIFASEVDVQKIGGVLPENPRGPSALIAVDDAAFDRDGRVPGAGDLDRPPGLRATPCRASPGWGSRPCPSAACPSRGP